MFKKVTAIILIVGVLFGALVFAPAYAYDVDNSSIYNHSTTANNLRIAGENLHTKTSGVWDAPTWASFGNLSINESQDAKMFGNITSSYNQTDLRIRLVNGNPNQSTALFKMDAWWGESADNTYYESGNTAKFREFTISFYDWTTDTLIDSFSSIDLNLDGFWETLPRIVRNFNEIRIENAIQYTVTDNMLWVADVNVANGVFLADFKITKPTDNYITKYDLQVVDSLAPSHIFFEATTTDVGFYEFIPPQAVTGFKFSTNSTGAGNIEDLSDMLRVFADRFTASGFYPIKFNVWETGLDPDIDPRSFEVTYNVFYDANRSTPLVAGENDPNTPSIEPTMPTPPENGWDIIGWLKYITDWIIFLFEVTIFMLKQAGDAIKELVLATTGLASVLETFFSFLPPEVLTIFLLGITVVVLLRIFGR